MRTKLDTRTLERIGANPDERAVEHFEKLQREKKVNRAWAVIRLGLCAFCGWFAFSHVRVFVSHGMLVLEVAGVIACVTFIVQSIMDMVEENR